ncbi:hypothetical protein GCM10009780_38450 [Actinomadura alba]
MNRATKPLASPLVAQAVDLPCMAAVTVFGLMALHRSGVGTVARGAASDVGPEPHAESAATRDRDRSDPRDRSGHGVRRGCGGMPVRIGPR